MSRDARLPPGLYLVATPIGNLEDMGGRAARVLREADVVACEDTRHSAPLLTHVGATGRRLALHEHNEDKLAHKIVDEVKSGSRVALITDAGMPLISDPGFPVVREAIRQDIPVTVIPGPSAPLAALCLSGLPSARFHFAGFLPDKVSRRQALLEELRELSATLIFFAPARELKEVLSSLEAVLGDRPAAICRELTKLHEEVRRGTLKGLQQEELTLLGEAVVVVGGAEDVAADEHALDNAIRAGLSAGEPPSSLAKRLARELRLSRAAVYERILALKG
ncbi:MAG: 16S rRNA (cytidine(1402)-2'-O)-methyltransferase [Myxococcota bacterium]